MDGSFSTVRPEREDKVIESLFILSVLLLAYIWPGYYVVLMVLVKILPDRRISNGKEGSLPFISILISAYNEADVIEQRIRNLLSLDYPKEKMEILIGSDGSSDETVKIAESYNENGVIGVDFKKNKGRADVHNDLIRIAKGNILIFTDADTVFDSAFIKNIVKPFFNPKVGVAVGKLLYKVSGGDIAENEGIYLKYEQRIKEMENNLGIINNGTGACMAFRKELFSPLTPVDDVDTASVIDIILKGFKAVYIADAVAYDIPPHSVKSEFKMRVRGTSKTLSSLRRRTNIVGWLKHPVLIWSLFSHRLGRYLTPYLMLITLLSNIFLLSGGIIYNATFAVQLLFYFLVILGWIGNATMKRIPLASVCFSFFIAISGMLVGVIRAVIGRVNVTYKTDDNALIKN